MGDSNFLMYGEVFFEIVHVAQTGSRLSVPQDGLEFSILLPHLPRAGLKACQVVAILYRKKYFLSFLIDLNFSIY